MAEQLARKRHKPIEPPSPEQRRQYLSSNYEQQQFYNRHQHHQQRLPFPPPSPRQHQHAFVAERQHHHHHRHEKPQLNEEEIYDQQRRRAKASVFERLGGNVENAKLRSQVVVTKMKAPELGDGKNARKAAYIPPENEIRGASRELESEEAWVLEERCRVLKRQLEELDEDEEGVDVGMAMTGSGSRMKVADKRLNSAASSSKQSNKNGVVNVKHQAHYKNDDQQQSYSNLQSTSPASSAAASSTVRRQTGAGRRGHRDEERLSMDGDRKPQYHHDNLSVKSYGSSSRRYESTTSKRTEKHANGDRLGHGVVESRGADRKRSPSAETSSSRRSRRSANEMHRCIEVHRDFTRQQYPNAPIVVNAPSGDGNYWHRQEQIRRAPPPPLHRHEYGNDGRGGNLENRRAMEGLGDHRPPHAFGLPPQHHEHHRRLPDRFYERTDDRGNHSKTRTSTIARNEHQQIQMQHRTRDELRSNPISSSLSSSAKRNDLRTLKNEPTTSRRYPLKSGSGSSSRIQPNAVVDVGKKHLNERRKRPSSAAETSRSGSTSKRAKYDEIETKSKRRQDGHSKTTTSKIDEGNGKRAKIEKHEFDTTRPCDDNAALQQGELEPISDEEVDEVSGESTVVQRVDQAPDEGPSTSENNKWQGALDVEWSEVMAGDVATKSSSSDRRRCLDVNYFLPTIGICADYVDDKILNEASTAAGGCKLEAAKRNYATILRSRLLGDVGSTFRRAMSARVDLKMRRQLCGLVAEGDVASNTMELNAPLNGRTFRKALWSFEKWTKNDDDDQQLGKRDEFRTTQS